MDDRDVARWLNHAQEHGFIRARLRLLTADEGGRSGPIYSGYRSCWGFPREVHQDMHVGPLLIEGKGVLSPGEVATVRLHPLVPEHWPHVSEGLSLGMFEGSRRVGEAVVLEVVGLGQDEFRNRVPSLFPLMDDRHRYNLSELEFNMWAHNLTLCAIVGLDREQVTDMEELPPDPDGNVVLVWWAVTDQGAPTLGTDMGNHVRLEGATRLWTGRLRLTATEMAELRPRIGTQPTQEDADWFLAGEPDEDDAP